MTEMHAHFLQGQQNSVQKKKNMVVIVADYQLNHCFLWLFFFSSSLFLVKRRKKLMIHTTVAARELDLSLPRNSRAELSIVWQNTLFSERKCENYQEGQQFKFCNENNSYQSENLMRSGACFIQECLPNLSLSCNELGHYFCAHHASFGQRKTSWEHLYSLPSQTERSSLKWFQSLRVSSVSFSTVVPLYQIS